MIGLVSFGGGVIYVFLSFVHRPHNTFVIYKVKTDVRKLFLILLFMS